MAGLSARAMAEAAAREGITAWALDLFGDEDTCAACAGWRCIGDPAALAIDDGMLLAALRSAARDGGVECWIAGSGLDDRFDLLRDADAVLPRLGTATGDLRRLRDPAEFFGFLDGRRIPHPPVDLDRARKGWLIKRAGGCGGWHIERAACDAPLPPGCYAQLEVAGQPMSVTFVADGRCACVLGVNRQRIGRVGAAPFVYQGIVGPVRTTSASMARLTAIVDAVAHEFALRGLASLDFMLDGETPSVLEVNARVPASVELYSRAGRAPLDAHRRACLHGELPPAPTGDGRVHGNAIVYARRALHIDAGLAEALAAAGASDRPRHGQTIGAGEPVCSVGASAADADRVERLLDEGIAAVHDLTEYPR